MAPWIHTINKHQILLCFRRKYSSSATLLEYPPVVYGGNRTSIEPRLLLSNPKILRGLTLGETKAAHALLLKTCVIYSNIYTANNLIDAYSECSRMDYAFKLFDEMPMWNVVAWNLIITGSNKNFLYEDSWRVFCRMHNVGVDMDEFTYSSILSTCAALEHVARAMQVHGLVTKNGFSLNEYVRAAMIIFFAKCSKVGDALMVLYDVHCDHVVCWNAVVSGAVKNKENWVALDVFAQMCRHSSLIPNASTLMSALTACAAAEELEIGQIVHGRVIKIGAEGDVFVGSAVLNLYAKCGVMFDAIKQFKLMPIRNVVSWTTVISGFVQKGDSGSAFQVLTEMQRVGEEINSFTVSSVLSACAIPDMFEEALQIHCWALKIGLYSDPAVKASLINTYSKVGSVNLSEIVFAETQDLRQVSVYTNMISAFAQCRNYEKTIILLREMIRTGTTLDKYGISSILSIMDSLTLGRQVHGYALKLGLVAEVSVGCSILIMYSKCGNLEESLKAFEQLETKDSAAWTSMIIGLVENGCPDKAIKLFKKMGLEESIPDEKSLAAVLNACSYLPCSKLGREIHGFALQCGFSEGRFINEALMNMYSKCGDLSSAKSVCLMMPFKDEVSWSSLISGFCQKGHVEEALRLFHHYHLYNMSVDAFTISSILRALASSSNSNVGTQLHSYTIKVGSESDSSIGSSLILMYSKCGNIGDCDKVFEQMKGPDLVCWTTMITSYAHHGKGHEALQLFERMKRSKIKPDAVTFSAVLSACSHAGLVEEGYSHLNAMMREYGIEPGPKHYACMVCLLGRAGRFNEAEGFIANMPIKPGIFVWETLLASCKVHGNHELGKIAAEKIMELGPSDAITYVSVSNLYAEAREWERALEIRGWVGGSGVRKDVGWSFVR
ncbi:hypothetical protein ACS0TY_035329 [Phlomoides rotata]